MTDANRTKIGIITEATWGVTPTTPVFETLRITQAPNLAYAPRTIVSNELRSDRQVSDLVLVGAEAGGDIGFELSFGSLDTILTGALFNTWTRMPTIVNATADTEISDVAGDSPSGDSTITVVDTGDFKAVDFKAGMLVLGSGFTNSGNNAIWTVKSSAANTIVMEESTMVDEAAPPLAARLRVVGFVGASGVIAAAVSPNRLTSSGIDFTTLGLVVGDWIKIGGSAAGDKFATKTANNDWVRISAISATTLTLDIVPSGWDADDGAGKTIKCWIGDRIRNSTKPKSFSIEEVFEAQDTPTYQLFTGMQVNRLGITARSADIVNGTVSFMGKAAAVGTASAGTYSAAPTYDVLNTTSDVGRIAQGGSIVASPNYVLEARIEINNNLRARTAIGNLGAVSIGAGECSVSGGLDTYFGSKALLDALLNNTASSFDLRFFDSTFSNKTILIDIPRMKLSSGYPEVPGKNQDVPLRLGFQAYRHETLGYTICFQEFHYVE